MFSKECLQAVHTFHLVKAIDSFQNQMVMRSAIDRFNGFCLASFLCERNKRITNNTTDWHEQTNMFTPKRLAKIYKSVTKKKQPSPFIDYVYTQFGSFFVWKTQYTSQNNAAPQACYRHCFPRSVVVLSSFVVRQLCFLH